MLIVGNHYLFADAEVGEDFGEDVGGGDFAGDFAQIVHALAYVLAHQVATEAGLQALDAACESHIGSCEGFIVACVGHDKGIVAQLWQSGCRDDALLQAIDVQPLACRDEDGVVERGLQPGLHGRGEQVEFVDHGDELLVGEMWLDACFKGLDVVERLGWVDHPQHQLGFGKFLEGAFNAHFLDLVLCLANACRVDKSK